MNVGGWYRIDKYFPHRADAEGGHCIRWCRNTVDISVVEVKSLGSKTSSEIIEPAERM